MTEADVINVLQDSFWAGLRMVMYPMLTGLGIGLAVALFQALTQIQEMTLTFAPKIIAILGVTVLTLPTMYGILEALTMEIADKIVGI